MKDHSATQALVWTYSGMFVKLVCQFVIGIVIARLLGPEPYGIVAIATVVISFGGLLSDGGISAALVRFQDATLEEIGGAFWVQVVTSLIISLIVFTSAPFFVSWLNAPDSLSVLQALTLLFPINALASISLSLHRRNLNMRPIQIATIVSYLISYGLIGLLMAYLGFGVWALVWAQLSQSLINAAILLYTCKPNVLSPCWPNRLVGFGGWTILSNLTAWAQVNLINIFFAKIFGPVALGNYNRLSLITGLTVPIIGGPLQQVIFPAVAKSTEDQIRYDRIIEAIFRLIGLIFLPAMIIMAIFHGSVVSGIFGSKFSSVSNLLPPLALAALGQIWIAIASLILAGKGLAKAQWLSQFLPLPIFFYILWKLSAVSPIALCWGFFLGVLLIALFVLIAVLRSNVLTVRQIVSGFAPTIIPALSGTLFYWFSISTWNGFSPEMNFLLATGCALLGWILSVIVFSSLVLPYSFRCQLLRRFGMRDRVL